jgi:hypothetical protein
MFNEDTGEEPKCPVCGASKFWECGHLLADFDITFCEVYTGSVMHHIDAIEELASSRLKYELRTGDRKIFDDEELQSRWNDSIYLNRNSKEDAHIDYGFLISWCIITLAIADAVDADGPIINDGPPGFSSHIRLLFAKDADATAKHLYRQATQEFQ